MNLAANDPAPGRTNLVGLALELSRPAGIAGDQLADAAEFLGRMARGGG